MIGFEPLPALTRAVAGIGGTIRATPDDFVVDERLTRPPSGHGRFAWIRIVKRGISTPELLRRLGAALGVKGRDLQAAGYKDAKAVTTQWVSVPASAGGRAAKLGIKDAESIETARDHEPLSSRLIAANAFRIAIRGCDTSPAGQERARTIVDEIAKRGLPNGYGPQRFGVRGESAAVGAALVQGDVVRALDLILGSPSDAEQDSRAAVFRGAYERGDFSGALASCPGALRLERRLLEALARGEHKVAVARAIPQSEQRFYLAAWQSLLFNRVLARRIGGTGGIDAAWDGDLLVAESGTEGEAIECANGAAMQEAVAAFRLSPSGPLFGSKVALAGGTQGETEREVLAAAGFASISRLHPSSGIPLHGQRRAMRVRVRNVTLEATGSDTIVVGFELPSGAFATTLLAEVMK